MSRRFFVDPADIQREGGGFVAHFGGEEAYHAVRVLRLSPGDDVVLLDDSGLEYHGKVQEISGDAKRPSVVVRGDTLVPAPGEPRFGLTLVQALPKGDKMDHIVQKGTETGVTHFVPVVSERVVVEYSERKIQARLERWRRIAQEAAKQAKRGRRPSVAPVTKLGAALEAASLQGPVLVLWEGATRPIKEALRVIEKEQLGLGKPSPRELNQRELGESNPGERETGSGSPTLTLVIGPEGGFSQDEAQMMEALGGRLVSLGPRILRTETAGPVAAALTLYQLETF